MPYAVKQQQHPADPDDPADEAAPPKPTRSMVVEEEEEGSTGNGPPATAVQQPVKVLPTLSDARMFSGPASRIEEPIPAQNSVISVFFGILDYIFGKIIFRCLIQRRRTILRPKLLIIRWQVQQLMVSMDTVKKISTLIR